MARCENGLEPCIMESKSAKLSWGFAFVEDAAPDVVVGGRDIGGVGEAETSAAGLSLKRHGEGDAAGWSAMVAAGTVFSPPLAKEMRSSSMSVR